MLLKSWARRWNEFAPEPLRTPPELLEAVIQRVGLAQAEVKTTLSQWKSGKIVGFKGHAVLAALKPERWSAD